MDLINKIAPFESVSWFHLRVLYKNAESTSTNLLTRVEGKWMLRNFPTEFLQGSVYGKSFSELLESHTIYPSLKLLSEKTLKLVIYKVANKIKHREQLARLLGQSNSFCDVKFCSLCFEEQLKEYGYNWLLRDWQLPLVTCCYKHKIRLNSYNCFCSFEEQTAFSVLSGTLTGVCPKCLCSTWEVEYEKASLKNLSISKWMVDYAKFKPIYISKAMHKTLFLRLNGFETATSVSIEESVKKLYPRYGHLGKQEVYRLLRRWSNSEYPIDPEMFFMVVIKKFKTPELFHTYILSLNVPVYLDYFEIGKKADLSEGYRFFEGLTIRNERPSDYAWGRFIRVLI